MRKLTTIVILFFAISFLPSCEKETETETDITIIENQLKSFLDENNVDKFTIYLMSGDNSSTFFNTYEARIVTIQDGFVTIKTADYDERFNLLYLSRFKLSGDKTISLYFADTSY